MHKVQLLLKLFLRLKEASASIVHVRHLQPLQCRTVQIVEGLGEVGEKDC